MPVFAPPTADHLFTLYDLLGFERHTALPGFEHCSRDVIEAVLEQSARFSSEVLYPLHRTADEDEGNRHDEKPDAVADDEPLERRRNLGLRHSGRRFDLLRAEVVVPHHVL